MNTIPGVPSSDVPQLLTVEAGSNIPSGVTIKGENGAAISTSSLTAFFNSSGTYVGAIGIDPSTGAFSAWDANGNETSFQAFAAEHNLQAGATPISSSGGAAVLYNSSGQVIGLDVAGYTVNVPTSEQSGSVVDGLTDVYSQDDALLGSFGYSTATDDLVINGQSADSLLESEGFTSAEISTAETAVASTGNWNVSGSNVVAIARVLEQVELQRSSTSEGSIGTSVYNASGAYQGSFTIQNGSMELYIQDGVNTLNAGSILNDAGVTNAQITQGINVLTNAASLSTANYANAKAMQQALVAYTLASGAAGNGGLINTIDTYDNGNFTGTIGENTSGDLVLSIPNNIQFDLHGALLTYGLTATQITNGKAAENATNSTILSASQLNAISTLVNAADAIAADPLPYLPSTDDWLLTSQEVAGATPTQLANLTSTQLADLEGPQLGELSPAQVAALNVSELTTSAFQFAPQSFISSLTTSQMESLSTAQLAVLSSWSGQVLSASQLASLSALQVAALSSNQVGMEGNFIDALSPAKLSAISPTAFASIVPQAFSGFTQAQLQALTPSQLGQMLGTQFYALSPTQIGYFSAEQLAVLPAGMYLLTAAEFNAMTSSQIAAISPQDIATISPSALAGLNSSTIAAFTTAQISALSPSQFTALSSLQLSSFRTVQLAGITSAQIAAINIDQNTALQNASISAGVLAAATGYQGLNNPIGPIQSGPQVTVGTVLTQWQQDQGFLSATAAAAESLPGSGYGPGYSSPVTQISPTQWQVNGTIYNYSSSNGDLVSSVTTLQNGSQLTMNYQDGSFTGGTLQSQDGVITDPTITPGANGTLVISDSNLISNQIQIVSTGSDAQVIAAGYELGGAAAAIGNLPNGENGADGFLTGTDIQESGAEASAAGSGSELLEALAVTAPLLGLALGSFDSYYSFNVVGASGTTVSVVEGALGQSATISNPGSSTTSSYSVTIQDNPAGGANEQITTTAPNGDTATETLSFDPTTNQTTDTITMGSDSQTTTESGNTTDAIPTTQTLPTNLLGGTGGTNTTVLSPDQVFSLDMAAESMSDLDSMSSSGDFTIDNSQTTTTPLML